LTVRSLLTDSFRVRKLVAASVLAFVACRSAEPERGSGATENGGEEASFQDGGAGRDGAPGDGTEGGGGLPPAPSDGGFPPLVGGASSGSVRFRSRPDPSTPDNHGKLGALPPTFGAAELTFELWFQAADLDRIPAGDGYDRRLDWSTTDAAPYSRAEWW